jgi:hypothetical protein
MFAEKPLKNNCTIFNGLHDIVTVLGFFLKKEKIQKEIKSQIAFRKFLEKIFHYRSVLERKRVKVFLPKIMKSIEKIIKRLNGCKLS